LLEIVQDLNVLWNFSQGFSVAKCNVLPGVVSNVKFECGLDPGFIETWESLSGSTRFKLGREDISNEPEIWLLKSLAIKEKTGRVGKRKTYAN